MINLKPHEKSAVRVGHLTVQHLRHFRLSPYDARSMTDADLQQLGSALIDYTERLLAERIEKEAGEAGTPGGQEARQRIRFGRNKNTKSDFWI